MRILMSCVPTEGHFRPLLPLARALKARGHDVAFAAASAWEPRVAEEGFPLLAAGIPEAERRRRFAPFHEEIYAVPPEVRRPFLFTRMFALIDAPAKLPELIDVAGSWGAEAIVYDSCDLAAPIAAASLDVPSINHSFGAMIPLAALERAHEAIAPLWRAEGLEPAPYAGAFRGLHIDLAPPSFAWAQPLGENVRMSRRLTFLLGARLSCRMVGRVRHSEPSPSACRWCSSRKGQTNSRTQSVARPPAQRS